MTAYSAVMPAVHNPAGTSTWAQSLALRNGLADRDIAIVRIDLTHGGGSGGSVDVTIARYAASTIAGGTSITPRPLRQGSLASSATARFRPFTYDAMGPTYAQGAAVTVSGTRELLTTLNPTSGEKQQVTFPGDVTLAPGGVLYVANSYANATGLNSWFTNLVIWFQELPFIQSS